MRHSASFLFLLLSLFLLFSCNNSDKIIIQGTYKGENKSYISLNRIDVNEQVYIDSVQIRKSGKFRFALKSDLPQFYNVGFNVHEFVTIIAYPGDNITLGFFEKPLQNNYQISGSKESADLKMLDDKLDQTLASLDSLSALYRSLSKENEQSTEKTSLGEKYSELFEAQRMYNIEYIIENLSRFSSIKALYQRFDKNTYVLYKPNDAQYLKLVSDSINHLYPKSKQAKSLAQNLSTELNKIKLDRIRDMASLKEPIDMDISLKDIDGKRVKLSSLRNSSIVLLLFWSSKSKKSIVNNIQLKDVYKRYHQKGLEIYSVNLDADQNAWRQAVKFDELPWINVHEDDTTMLLSATKYNVTELPTNYIVDKNGEIIGKNFFGRSLEIKLNQLFD